MSLWRFTDRALNPGDRTDDGYLVLAVEFKVPPSVKIGNYGARHHGLPEKPEIPQRCLQLLGLPFQLKLVFT